MPARIGPAGTGQRRGGIWLIARDLIDADQLFLGDPGRADALRLTLYLEICDAMLPERRVGHGSVDKCG